MSDYRVRINDAMAALSDAIEDALEKAEVDTSFARGLLNDVYDLEAQYKDALSSLEDLHSMILGVGADLEMYIQR